MRQYRYECWLMEKTETVIKAITHNIDRDIWRDLMKKSGMLSLMDAQAARNGIAPLRGRRSLL